MFVAALFCFIFVIFLIISEHTTFDDACRSVGGVASDLPSSALRIIEPPLVLGQNESREDRGMAQDVDRPRRRTVWPSSNRWATIGVRNWMRITNSFPIEPDRDVILRIRFLA
jgi:hypothetical protein